MPDSLCFVRDKLTGRWAMYAWQMFYRRNRKTLGRAVLLGALGLTGLLTVMPRIGALEPKSRPTMLALLLSSEPLDSASFNDQTSQVFPDLNGR